MTAAQRIGRAARSPAVAEMLSQGCKRRCRKRFGRPSRACAARFFRAAQSGGAGDFVYFEITREGAARAISRVGRASCGSANGARRAARGRRVRFAPRVRALGKTPRLPGGGRLPLQSRP
ncbi:hypothetical protein WT60_08540 [Burkholderia sp. MSMB617WGS]|nr:hypothetical protein WS86_08405 [Burkholderia savannae]AOK46883.1 hypothetical protein WT60_08540 [Burkholderia sp. MSMB617WGS]KWZ45907.1 hypothetical protein WS73_17550 [Burkholderia savannae]